MISALKCCGSGAAILRRSTAVGSSLDASVSQGTLGDYYINSLCCSNINWSQKRFLRGNSPSTPFYGRGNPNARFVQNEIVGQMISKSTGSSMEQVNLLSQEKELRKFSRSVREHQLRLRSVTRAAASKAEKAKKGVNMVAEISKLIVEQGSPAVRVKSKKDETLLKEWISIQPELLVIKSDRIDDYRKKLQIAGQKAFEEMEANLQKASNLEDLDQAIEGALCSEAKREYTQKSLHDN